MITALARITIGVSDVAGATAAAGSSLTESGADTNWPLWIALALAGATLSLIYRWFFQDAWSPPENPRFVDHNASVLTKRLMQVHFSWGTPVWVTDRELGSGALEAPIPLSSIRSVRKTKWYMRTAPVIVLECEDENRRETIQLAVQDWHRLESVLAATQENGT